MKTRTKTTGLLIEIMIAILFFSIACAVVLQIFAASKTMSAQSREQTLSLNTVQSIGDTFRSDKEFSAALESQGFIFTMESDGNFTLYFNADMAPCDQASCVYIATVALSEKVSAAGTLSSADIALKKGQVECSALTVDKYVPAEVAS